MIIDKKIASTLAPLNTLLFPAFDDLKAKLKLIHSLLTQVLQDLQTIIIN